MERRKFMIGAGSTAIGASAIVGSGAFSIARMERDVTVNVADDNVAYLGLTDESQYADIDDGELALTWGEDDPERGDGLNPNSKTQFQNVFTIENQGTNDVQVTIGTGDNTAYDLNNPIIWWTRNEETGSGILPDSDDAGRWDEGDTAFLEHGDNVWVHFTFDQLGEIVDDPDDPEELEAITLYAETTSGDDDPTT